MKALTYVVLILGLSFTGCKSQKKLVENPPFELGEATCQRWVGGRAESGSGILLQVPILNDNMDEMKFQQAFFRGRVTDVSMKSNDGSWFAEANFRNKTDEKPDMIMHSDSEKEVGNQPPKFKEKMPFELGENECVLSYMEGDKVKYYKVSGIKEKKPLIYQ